MGFSELIITANGLNLVNESLTSDKQIVFTGMAASDYLYELNQLGTLEEIADVKQCANIRKTDISELDIITIDSIFDNESVELTEGYFIRTIGLYSKIDEESEILFAVAVEKSNNPSYMPAHGLTTTAIQIKFRIKLSNTANISITVDSAGMATIGDVTDVTNELRNSVKSINGTIQGIKDDALETNAEITDLKNTKLDKTAMADSAVVANSFKVPRVDTDVNTLPGVFTGTIKEQMKTSDNLPTSEYYHVITLEGGDANYNTQLAIGMTTTAMYYRNRQNGTWSAWNEIVLGQIVNGLFELPRGVRFKGSIITLDSFRVNAGNKIRMWSDNEGGNLEIESPDGVKVQMDACGNNFRIYMQKSDGSLVFPFNINSNDGYVNIPYLSSTGGISTNKLSIGNVIVNKDGDFQHASNNKEDGWGILNNAGQVKFGVTYEDGTLFAGNAIIIPDSNGGIFYFGGSINPDRQYPMLKITQFTNSLQILPTQANTCTIGHNTIPFEAVTAKNIYNSSGLITSSDRNKKRDFAEITLEFALQIIDRLEPKSFKYKDGTSGRTHYGFVAQDVEELLEELGIDNTDFAPLIKEYPTKEVENEDGSKTLATDYDAEPEYFLRYEGFTGLIIKYIQGLKQENTALKDKMSSIEERLELLENKLNNI